MSSVQTATPPRPRSRALALGATAALACTGIALSAQPNMPVAAESLQSWDADVVRIVDGDTVEVTIGNNPAIIDVRVAGLQTNEVYRDDARPSECHSAEATQRLTELLMGEQVELFARDPSSQSYNRPIRHVFLEGENIAGVMLREGFGIPVSFTEEPDFAVENTNQAMLAARDGIGVWDSDYCGVGPAAGAELEMLTNFDAAGDDTQNVNGEYVQLRNLGDATISFDGWQIRDSALRRFSLPNGITLASGGRLRIFVGQGTNTSDRIYLGEPSPILGNISDGMFLYDSDFDIRAFDMWPCTDTCIEPLPLRIETVNYDADGDDRFNPNGEFIVVRNVGTDTIDFQDWMLEIPPLQLTSVGSRPIAPGDTLTVLVGQGSNTVDKMFFQQAAPILNNAQHLVILYDPDRAVVDCDARGSKVCPSVQIAGETGTLQSPASAFRPAVRLDL